MASPFDAFTSGVGGIADEMGSVFSGLGSTLGSMGSSMGLSGNGPSLGNVFANMFDPSNNTGLGAITGAIGGLFGMPTYAQREAATEADAMQKLSAMHQLTGGNPQATILKFLQSQDGAQLMSRPGAAGVLEKWVHAVTPPPPTAIPTMAGTNNQIYQSGAKIGDVSMPPERAQNMKYGVPETVSTGEGGRTDVYGPQGTNARPVSSTANPPAATQNWNNGVPQINNVPPGNTQTNTTQAQGTQPAFYSPTTDSQTFKDLTGQIPGITSAQLGFLAQAHLAPSDNMQRAIAINNMVAHGSISEDVGNKLKSDSYLVYELTDEAGHPNHQFMMFDKTTGKQVPLQAMGGGVGGAAPGQVEPMVNIPSVSGQGPPMQIPQSVMRPGGEIDGDALINHDPYTAMKFMFLRTGFLNGAVSLSGNMLRMVDPTQQDPESIRADRGDTQIKALKASVAALGSRNTRLHTVVEKWLDTVPEGHTDPVDAYGQGITLHQTLDRIMAQEMQYLDPRNKGRYTANTVEEARQTVDSIQKVFALMPSIADMQDVMDHLKIDPNYGGNVTPGQAGAVIGNAAGGIVRGLTDTVVGAFSGNPGTPQQSTLPPNGQWSTQTGNPPPAPAPAQPLPSTADIRKMQPADLTTLRVQMQKAGQTGTPQWEALRARLNALSAEKTRKTQPAKTGPSQDNPALQYSGSNRPPGPSVKQFTQNPTGAPQAGHPLDPIMQEYLRQRGGNTFAPSEEIMPSK